MKETQFIAFRTLFFSVIEELLTKNALLEQFIIKFSSKSMLFEANI